MRRNRFGELTDDSPEHDLDPVVDAEEVFLTEDAAFGALARTEALRFRGFESPARMRSDPGEPMPEPVERCEADPEEERPGKNEGAPERPEREAPFLRAGEPADFHPGEAERIERTLEAGTVFAASEGEGGHRLRIVENGEPADGPRYRATRSFRAAVERDEGTPGIRYRTSIPLAELIELRALERLDGNASGGGEGTDG